MYVVAHDVLNIHCGLLIIKFRLRICADGLSRRSKLIRMLELLLARPLT